MTVNSTTSRVSYAGNGVTVTFSVPFYFLAAADLVVIRTSSSGVQTTLVLNTDYTASGAGNQAGGSITCAAAPASGESLVIYRDPAVTQLVDYQPNDPFPAATHETALDKLTMISQRLKDLLNRSFRLSDGDTSNATTTLPSPSSNTVIGWNQTGTGLQNIDPSALATIVAYGTANSDLFSGNGLQTQFTLTDNPGNINNLDVAIGGVTQTPSIDYTWAGGTTLTFFSPPPAGTNNILVRYMQGLPQSGAALPNQTGNAGKFLRTDGTNPSWQIPAGVAKRAKEDFGAVGDGVADDTTALRNAIAAMPEGSTLVLDGMFRITDTVRVDKRVSLYCFGANNGILVDVGITKDGILYYGNDPAALNGLNGMDIRLNVYGRANACKHGIVFQRVDRSRIQLNVRVGADAYGVRLRGCLINQWDIESSANYTAPITSPGMQRHHMAVENFGVPSAAFVNASVSGPASPAVVTWNGHGFSAGQSVVFNTSPQPPSPFDPGAVYYVISTGLTANTFQLSTKRDGPAVVTTTAGGSVSIAAAYGVASNTNRFWVNFEGGTDGYIQGSMYGEGANTLIGEIEGLTGVPIFADGALGLTVYDMKMEQNGQASLIDGVLNLRIGPGVINLGPGPGSITLRNCRGYTIDGYYGSLNVEASNVGGTFGLVQAPTIASHTLLDRTMAQISPATHSENATVLAGGPGTQPMVALFANPFFDIYDANDPTVGPPVGMSMQGSYTSGDLIRETSVTFPGSPGTTSVRCLSRGTTITNGAIITPGIQPWKDDDWVSVMIPIYCLNNNGRAEVYIDDGVTYHLIGRVTQINTWTAIRGSAKLIAGNNWRIRVAIGNLSGTYGNGYQYYIGGLNVVKGSVPPRTIENTITRMSYVGTSITYAPFRQGAIAIVGTAPPIAYIAVSNGSPTDWKQIT